MAITVTPHPKRVRVRFNGRTVADSTRALALREDGHATVLYLPRADAEPGLLTRSSRTSHCPHKGDAAYYSLAVDGRSAENAAWTYETPRPELAAIAGHLAFYPDRVDAIEEG
ncbi:MAG: DUF427 domain-containing protein [Geminicoccaceae bacterium]